MHEARSQLNNHRGDHATMSRAMVLIIKISTPPALLCVVALLCQISWNSWDWLIFKIAGSQLWCAPSAYLTLHSLIPMGTYASSLAWKNASRNKEVFWKCFKKQPEMILQRMTTRVQLTAAEWHNVPCISLCVPWFSRAQSKTKTNFDEWLNIATNGAREVIVYLDKVLNVFYSILQSVKEDRAVSVCRRGRECDVQLSVLKGKNITHLAVGGSEQVDSQTLAIVSPGKLFTAGDNTYGQLVRVRIATAERVVDPPVEDKYGRDHMRLHSRRSWFAGWFAWIRQVPITGQFLLSTANPIWGCQSSRQDLTDFLLELKPTTFGYRSVVIFQTNLGGNFFVGERRAC